MVLGAVRATPPTPGPTATTELWQPPEPAIAGTAPMALPQWVPSALRRAWIQAVRSAELRVFVTEPAPQPKAPDYLARTPAERQHRRHSWTQRAARHQLQSDVEVALEFRQAHGLADALARAGFSVVTA